MRELKFFNTSIEFTILNENVITNLEIYGSITVGENVVLFEGTRQIR